MVSGLIICGFGFGGFFFGIIANTLCNPENFYVVLIDYGNGMRPEQLFPAQVAERVPFMLRTLAGIWVCLFLFGVLSVSTFEERIVMTNQVQLPKKA